MADNDSENKVEEEETIPTKRGHPILNLDDFVKERHTIQLEGKQYEMLWADELDLLTLTKVMSRRKDILELQSRLGIIEEGEEITKDKIDALELLHGHLNDIMKLIVPSMPMEKISKIRDTLKLKVLTVFTEAAVQESEASGPTGQPQLTGEKISQDSNGSTEENN